MYIDTVYVIHYLITYEIISLLILMFGKTKSLLKSRLETMKKKEKKE